MYTTAFTIRMSILGISSSANSESRISARYPRDFIWWTASIIAWKALGRDCTNNNGLILQIGVLSSLIINEGLYHTVFARIRYLGVYI